MSRKRNRWDSDTSEDENEAIPNSVKKYNKKKDKKKTGNSIAHDKKDGTPRMLRKNDENRSSKSPLFSKMTYNFYYYGCRSVENYARIGKIDEGTYGVVSKAKDKETGEIVALKQVKMNPDVCHEGFPITALRETNVLLALNHPHIIKVKEMVVGSTPDKIYMVMEYANYDLKTILSTKISQPLLQGEVKTLLQSLLSAVAYMHSNWYLHRDLKTSNLLYTSDGVLKVCDFGLARKYGSPVRPYTQLVVTLWYRAPELLLGASTYSTAIDIWSVGCIFAELLLQKPLFQGKGEIDQLNQIFNILGTPNIKNWPELVALPHFSNVTNWKGSTESRIKDQFPLAQAYAGTRICPLSALGLDLLSQMLEYNPISRISARDALNHPYFNEYPRPVSQEEMPKFD